MAEQCAQNNICLLVWDDSQEMSRFSDAYPDSVRQPEVEEVIINDRPAQRIKCALCSGSLLVYESVGGQEQKTLLEMIPDMPCRSLFAQSTLLGSYDSIKSQKI